MSVLGQQIKKYRISKGITQEQLGELVGVTTQAVSKWERGGTPDAELLPALSGALGVSIDALFGREDQSLRFATLKKLSTMEDEEAFRCAFDTFVAAMLGLGSGMKHFPDNHLQRELDYTDILDETPHPSTARIMCDKGMVNARLAKDFKYLFLMVEPKNGLRKQLADPERLCQVFTAFADADRLKILFYLYTRINTPIATSLISENVGISVGNVDRHMDILCRQGVLKRTVIATAEGEIYSYMFNQEDAVIAMLCFADELTLMEDPCLLWDIRRTEPIFESTDG